MYIEGDVNMGVLENHLSTNCDKRITGLVNFSLEEGFLLFNKIIKENEYLKANDFRNSYGMLRHSCIDFVLKNEFRRKDIDANITEKIVSPNGYKYPVIEAKGLIMTYHKVFKPYSMPKSAWNRDNRSFLNKEISLFDDEFNESYGELTTPYVMATYGGYDYKLQFRRLGIPNVGCTKWIDQINIENSLYVVKPYTGSQEKDLELSLNNRIKQYLEVRDNNDGTKKN